MHQTPAHLQEISWRDPSGHLLILNGEVLRLVKPVGVPDVTVFLRSAAGQRLLQSGRVVQTEILAGEQAERALTAFQPYAPARVRGALILRHERIPFPSFPYEWPPEMLHAAGVLTLDLAQELLPGGFGLKDGTPYNVLFRGPHPVFVDLLSFESRDPSDPTWLPYAQFVRTFLLPLLANRSFGVPLDQSLLMRRDGLEPEEVYRWLTPLQKVKSPFLTLVSLPVWLASRHDPADLTLYRKETLPDSEKARFIVAALLRRLRRVLASLSPPAEPHSRWSDYMTSQQHYTREQFSAKHAFVDEVCKEFAPRAVLDAGCNTGHFSVLAARRGARVVAVDYDPVVVGRLWRQARAESLDIQPLVVDLARPTPGLGWGNQECASFLDRAREGFDAVLMLALIHHLLVSERIPLSKIIALAAELTRDLLVLEFVEPGDSMFRRLTRGREDLYRGLTRALFEEVCRQRFDILRVHSLAGLSRHLYLLRKRKA